MHAHFIPQAYKEAFDVYLGGKNPDRFPMPDSSEQKTLEFLDEMNIARQVIGLSSPHINMDSPAVNKKIARACNEEMALLAHDHSDRLSFLASLSVPYVEDAIDEAVYSLDALCAVGITLPTNSKGVYMSDPSLEPLFEVLDERATMVVFHPNRPGSVPTGVGQKLPEPIIEFFFDTTRLVADLILKGYVERYPNIKFVVPHCGAALPVVFDRMALYASTLKEQGQIPDDFDVYRTASKLYYDLAGNSMPSQLKILLGYVPEDHFVYGSDYPFTAMSGVAYLAQSIADCDYLSDEQKRHMFYDNGQALLA